jgi:hypothetical protein
MYICCPKKAKNEKKKNSVPPFEMAVMAKKIKIKRSQTCMPVRI